MHDRVLMGSIDLARAVFPEGTPDTRLDILARWNLMKVGLNYNHGTGHGIGHYNLIHESPTQVRLYAKEEHPLYQVQNKLKVLLYHISLKAQVAANKIALQHLAKFSG